jgi:glutamyl-Q tRNA(Asp) synthetase
MNYVGRFAPSPTGPLHLGSLVCALASWLDAKAQQGQWLVRIEDIDSTRCHPKWADLILQQLRACGLQSDGPIVYQSNRVELYLLHLEKLLTTKLLYPCHCSRLQIEQARLDSSLNLLQAMSTTPRIRNLIYPGTCKNLGVLRLSDYSHKGNGISNKEELGDLSLRCSRFFEVFRNASIRIQVPNEIIHWVDRRLGSQVQNLSIDVGDFILKTRDDHFSYQWSVVVDDIDQKVTHIVRGEDLADNTPRQIFLYHLLNIKAIPEYLHVPLVKNVRGEKLSKQTQARPLNPDEASLDLDRAASHLGLSPISASIQDKLRGWVEQWKVKQVNPIAGETKMHPYG